MQAPPTLLPASTFLNSSMKPRRRRQASTASHVANSRSPHRSFSAGTACASRSERFHRHVLRDQCPDVPHGPQHPPHRSSHLHDRAHQNLPDSTMIAIGVGNIYRVVVAPPAYLAAHGRPKTPADLEKHCCVAFSVLASGPTWTFAESGENQDKSVRPSMRLSVNTAEAAIDAALAGVGLTNVLSYQVARHVSEGKLKIVLQSYEPAPIPVHILHACQGPLPLKMRRFLEAATPRLRKSLANDQASLTGRRSIEARDPRNRRLSIIEKMVLATGGLSLK